MNAMISILYHVIHILSDKVLVKHKYQKAREPYISRRREYKRSHMSTESALTAKTVAHITTRD